MRFLIAIIVLGIGFVSMPIQAEPQCIATDMATLKTALTEGTDGTKPCTMVFVTNNITMTEKLEVPDNKAIIGFVIEHPFQQPALAFDAKLTVNDCAIALGYGSSLSNLLITTTNQVQNAICINKGNNAIVRCSVDGSLFSGFVTGIRNASSGNSILTDNTINVIQNGIIIGNLPSNTTTLMRNRILTKAAGGIGISLATPPTIMLGNELFGYATLVFPKENKFPLGTAANLIKLNNLISAKDDGSDRSNFYELYNIFPKFLKPCDAPVGYAPYNEDGSCKTYVFGKAESPITCPLNQTKLIDGNCGCPEGMKLDTTTNLCFQEKIVEKPVEKIVEKIVEKPGPDISKDGKTPGIMQPMVASPGGGSNCSLAVTATAASPIFVFLAVITLTGLVAWRTRPQKVPYTKRRRNHD